MPQKVFINWDPLYEEVICVHTTEDGICEKCKKVIDEKRTCYQIEGDWFEIQEDIKKKTDNET
jgi:hypothetical protein